MKAGYLAAFALGGVTLPIIGISLATGAFASTPSPTPVVNTTASASVSSVVTSGVQVDGTKDANEKADVNEPKDAAGTDKADVNEQKDTTGGTDTPDATEKAGTENPND